MQHAKTLRRGWSWGGKIKESLSLRPVLKDVPQFKLRIKRCIPISYIC